MEENKMGEVKACINYETKHPLCFGDNCKSYTCKGCIGWIPIDQKVKGFVLKDGTVNCINFKADEE